MPPARTTNVERTRLELSEELVRYGDRLAEAYSFEDMKAYFDRARPLRAVVVGEGIIDEYQYCETIGKSGKEPILAARYLSVERFAGGSLAVANQVAIAADSVCLITQLGTRDSHEEFIRERLDPRVEPHFLYLTDAPTIVKRRFVEQYPLQKLFEIYVLNGHEGDAASAEALCATLEDMLPLVDVAIVTDYGHGMLGPEAVDVLAREAPYLALNTQVNADNRGFNTVSKYPRADFLCVSETEVRMEVRDRRRDLASILVEVSRKLQCETILVTRGGQGCTCYGASQGVVDVPAFTNHAVDRVGAGDAVLALTALCAVQGAPAEVLGVVGNAVGALAVAVVGNRAPVAPEDALTELEALLA